MMLFFIHAFILLPFIYLPLELLFHAETSGGFCVALGSYLILISTLFFWIYAFPAHKRKALLAQSAILLLAIACFIYSYSVSPTGSSKDLRFSQKLSGQLSFNRARITNLVPEIDQLKLGTYVFRYLPIGINEKQMIRLRGLVLDVYHELMKDESFRNAGSALGMCYEDIFTGKRQTLHFYEYVPRNLKKTKYPVLIFMHGSLGNFIGYTWVLKKVAEKSGVAVISPTYGCGNWFLDPECSTIEKTYEYIRSNPELDSDSVYVACLSNGGTGLTRTIAKNGQRYKGFIFISAVTEPGIYDSSNFISSAKDRPFLLIHGDKDDRIPVQSITGFEESLKMINVPVKSRYYPDEDHFLMFSKRDSMADEIANWIEKR
ncbi:MAG: hypothetical protein A2X48_12515 [Lentisphaerae bacterium GWF2_49_21]|nr:MAG: hypothetical protein A2X48_12515 [Lentisphaerae bacterium GWF2_49_21]